ncbi:MAG: hypothetical protein AAF667_02920 [Pseudomonadota bacterium]
MTGIKTSTAIVLSSKEKDLLNEAQEEGLKRAVTLLSYMTFSRKDMLKQGLYMAKDIGMADYKNTQGTIGTTKAHGVADDEIKKLLNAAFDKAAEKLTKNDKLRKALSYLGKGLSELLVWVKGQLLSGSVLAMLVPLYGNVKDIIGGAIDAVKAYGQKTAIDTLNDASPIIAAGLPTEALSAFTSFAKAERARAAAKSAYTMAKGIGFLLAEIFTVGAATVVRFAASIVEAVVGFVYSMVQGVMFADATSKFHEWRAKDELPTPGQFRTLIGGCSFVGCVFFASASYIGHFNMTSALSDTNKILSTNMLMSSIPKVNEAQKMACGYIREHCFEIDLRAEGKKYKWVKDMIKGYGTEKLHSEFVTKDASFWTKMKHKGKVVKHGTMEYKGLKQTG